MQPYVPGAGKRPIQLPRHRMSRWTELKIWWHEVDRVLIFLILLLMVFGTVAVAAASPASAKRLSTAATTLDPLYFFYRHLGWQAVGLATLFGASLLSRENARRFGVLLTGLMLVFLVLVPLVGSR